MSSFTELLIGGEGTELITAADGAITGKSFAYIVVNGAATFDTLDDSSDRDMTAATTEDGGCGIDTEIAVGIVLRAKAGRRIKNITLSAGSVIGVLST